MRVATGGLEMQGGGMTCLMDVWKNPKAVKTLVVVNFLIVLAVPFVDEWSRRHGVAGDQSGGAARFAHGYNWAAMVILLGSLALTYARFLAPFGRYLLDHLGQSAVFLLLLLLVWGLVGGGLGIPNLVWDEVPLERSWSALGAALLLALLGVNAYYLGITSDWCEGERLIRDMNRFLSMHGSRWTFLPWLNPAPQDPRAPRPDEINRHRLSMFLRFSRLPFFVLISLPALFPLLFVYVPWSAPEPSPEGLQWLGVSPEVLQGLGISGDVRAGWRPHLWSGLVWGGGLFLAVIVVKLLLRVNGTINNFLAWAKKGGPGAVAAPLAQSATQDGFLQYLLVVIFVYAFLSVCVFKHPCAKVLAGSLLLMVCASQLAITWILERNGRAKLADVKASVALVGVVLVLGLPVVKSDEPMSPAFAIFSLLGVLAIMLVVSERRDVRLVRFIGVGVFLSLLVIIAVRRWLGEPVTAQDMLALAALTPIVLFDLSRRSVGTTVGGRWAAAVAAFLVVMALTWYAWPLALAPVVLAGAVGFLGCCSTGPIAATGGERRRWVLLTWTLAAWILLVNYDPFKDRFEKLKYPRQADEPAPRNERLSKKLELVYPYIALNTKGHGLLGNRDVLDAWKGRVDGYWKDRPECSKPKLVIMCVSGGAIRSAYWAATVMEKLASSPAGEDGKPVVQAGEFYDHIRLITGASGGMVGMSYFVEALYRQEPRPPLAEKPKTFGVEGAKIPSKSLRDVASFIALQSPWRMLLPRIPGDGAFDRGLVLDYSWPRLQGVDFRDLRGLEQWGAIPSIVFSPMIVDDGRRLLISNLDLASHRLPRPADPKESEEDRAARLKEWAIPIARQDDLDNDNDGRSRNKFSVSAMELLKLVEEARDLTLATAARMSATFPFVSPAINLPTDPPLRIVDAGYYDNYGVHLANAWILQNREWLKEHTSGVLVVQTRDSVSKRERVGVPSESPGFFDRFFRGAELFGSVTQALLQARSSTNAFRNDQEFVAVNEVFRGMDADEGFVATVVFENTAYLSATEGDEEERPGSLWPGLDGKGGGRGMGGDVPMSWYLTRSEMRAIRRAFPDAPDDDALAAILMNFDNHRDGFDETKKYRPIGRAINYARLFKTGKAASNPDEYDSVTAKLFYDRFDGVADKKLAPAEGEGRGFRVKRLKSSDPIDGLRPEDVLVYAHSEWLNDMAGFEPPEVSADTLKMAGETLEDVEGAKKYYTREFERAMNYHRWQAVWNWWHKDHSTPRGAQPPAASPLASARAG